MHLLDARKDPEHPKVVAKAGSEDGRVIHSVRWPRRGKDRFLLVQGETSPKPICDENSGAFMTWSATGWKKSRSFQMIDEYRAPAGMWVDGRPAASVLGCSPSWFKEHPDFDNGGLVAAGFFDHGTRFLQVDPTGQIEEVGYYMPVGGSTISSLWVTDEIVYAIDIAHGIDVLRFNAGG